MAHVLKYSEWQDATGAWFCNDVQDLAGNSAKWWTPARMLGIEPCEFVRLLVEKYKPDRIKYFKESDVLMYSWKPEHYAFMHKFLLWVNLEARKRNFIC